MSPRCRQTSSSHSGLPACGVGHPISAAPLWLIAPRRREPSADAAALNSSSSDAIQRSGFSSSPGHAATRQTLTFDVNSTKASVGACRAALTPPLTSAARPGRAALPHGTSRGDPPCTGPGIAPAGHTWRRPATSSSRPPGRSVGILPTKSSDWHRLYLATCQREPHDARTIWKLDLVYRTSSHRHRTSLSPACARWQTSSGGVPSHPTERPGTLRPSSGS